MATAGDQGQLARTAPGRRQGPRPLALHLSVAALTWSSSQGVLPLLKNGSLPWKGPLQEASDLLASLAKANPKAVSEAVANEGRRRCAALLNGIETYRHHPYQRRLTEMPTLWREGTTRLLDYGGDESGGGAPILMVPSLINRSYVLDLSEQVSLMRWLAAQGLRCFLVDWDRPGPEERRFSLTDYIAGRLERALDRVMEETGRRPIVAGYCMGGDLALALAWRRQPDVSGLALLATPWDFHAVNAGQARRLGATLPALAPMMEVLGELPLDMIQALFACLDPELVVRKFLSFARFDPASDRAAAFVALEDWLNDGVALSAPVARECLGGWYGQNSTGNRQWRIAGRPVNPGEIDLPTLVLVPGQDRIVPPESASALGRQIPGAWTLTPAIGHIGMVVSRGAREAVWEPLLTWLKETSAQAA